MAKRYKITLTKAMRDELTAMTRKGKFNAAKIVHARALLLCDTGNHGKPWKVADVADALGVSSRTIEHIKQRFVEEGIEMALERRPSSKPRELVFGGEFEAQLTKLARSPAPEGHARWTIQLLTKKLVELKRVETVSTMTVHRALKRANCTLT
jgi:transposase